MTQPTDLQLDLKNFTALFGLRENPQLFKTYFIIFLETSWLVTLKLVSSSSAKGRRTDRQTWGCNMMLTAIPANPSPSVFAHNHTPPSATSSSPSQPGSPEDATISQSQSSSHHHHHTLRGMDSKAPQGGITSATITSNRISQGHPPTQLIPMSAVQQPFLLGTGAPAGYTLIQQLQGNVATSCNETPMLAGVQQMGALSRPAGVAMPALPSVYYAGGGRVQQQVETRPAMGFPQPVQQLARASLLRPLRRQRHFTSTPHTLTLSSSLELGTE